MRSATAGPTSRPRIELRFEQRILTTTFPWSDSTRGGKARAEAHHRLDRLHWLSRQGLAFSFDVEAKMAALRPIAEGWSERSGEEAADSNAPVVRSIDTDADPRVLDHVPISEILERARQAGQSDFFDYVERRPFIGLAEEKPARALAALTDAARKGDVPPSFWSAFLYVEKRKTDPARLARAIGGRLASLPPGALSTIAYPVTEWLQGLGERLFGELATVLDRLWDPLIAALPLRDDDREHRVDSSWANDALNAPVGKLASLLMKDPSTKGRKSGQGFPEAWTRRQEQLLALPGDMRRHALVMLGFQINWLFAIAPDWTSANLLTVVDDEGDDGDALWDGILWAARAPSRALYERLKPGLLARAMSPMRRRAEANVIGGFLLIGWGGDSEADPPEQLVTSAELREILVESDDDLRGQILWHLEHWSADPRGQVARAPGPIPHGCLAEAPGGADPGNVGAPSRPRLGERRLVSRRSLKRSCRDWCRSGMEWLRGFMLRSEAENHPALTLSRRHARPSLGDPRRRRDALAVQDRGGSRRPRRGARNPGRPPPVRTAAQACQLSEQSETHYVSASKRLTVQTSTADCPPVDDECSAASRNSIESCCRCSVGRDAQTAAIFQLFSKTCQTATGPGSDGNDFRNSP